MRQLLLIFVFLILTASGVFASDTNRARQIYTFSISNNHNENPAGRIDLGKGLIVSGNSSSSLPVIVVFPMVPSKFQHNVNLPNNYSFFSRFKFEGLPNNTNLIINNP